MPWLALATKPRYEIAAAEQLSAKELEVYVPLYRVRARWADRTKIIEKPLFPGYIFCKSQFEDRVKVLRTLGVRSIVSSNGSPCPISEADIDNVKRIALGVDLAIVPYPYVRVGQRVRITKGHLAGVEGILVREKRMSRVVVSVEAMQRAIALEIDASMLEPSARRKHVESHSPARVSIAS